MVKKFQIWQHELTWKEEDDNEGVEDGEPLDVGVRHALQDVVPPAQKKLSSQNLQYLFCIHFQTNKN